MGNYQDQEYIPGENDMANKRIIIPMKEMDQFKKWVKKNGGGYKEYLKATRLKYEENKL